MIATHVVYSVISGRTALPLPEQAPIQSLCALFVASIRAGNQVYDNAELGGALLGVYDALHLLDYTRLAVAPRGEIGLRTEAALVDLLEKSVSAAHTDGRLFTGVLLQTPFTVAVAVTPSGSVVIFDSHCHGEQGALIALASGPGCAVSAARLFTALVGTIRDGLFCVLMV